MEVLPYEEPGQGSAAAKLDKALADITGRGEAIVIRNLAADPEKLRKLRAALAAFSEEVATGNF